MEHKKNKDQSKLVSPNVYVNRGGDWRNGAVVYQVLVDRFAPPKNYSEAKKFFPSPKSLRQWHEFPQQGHFVEEYSLWSHEIDFWGGSLKSLLTKLDYIQDLGADVLYLNPIHLGYTNHKYDALDYLAISPEFGTESDLNQVVDSVHERDMKLVLDGVFNHMGKNSPFFQKALAGDELFSSWFYFGDEYSGGYRAWAGASNLPELNLENAGVREHVYLSDESVVKFYLKNFNVDGWRLDVAFELGYNCLKELTQAAHEEKPGSLIVGEIWNYPKSWLDAVDGTMNFPFREIVLKYCFGELTSSHAARMLEHIVDNCSFEGLLKSWLVIDNHDTERLYTLFDEHWQRTLAQVLQFTFPGCPNVYYGTELGMAGGDDPEMRAPMRWDWVSAQNEQLSFVKKLINLRKRYPALRIGDFRLLVSEALLAFERYTDKIGESVFVFANASAEAIDEWVLVPNSSLMNGERLVPLLSSDTEDLIVRSSLVKVSLPPKTIRIYSADKTARDGYTPYKRV